jgi:hypothetical protein
MTCGSIYKINFPNGKHYIGLTTTSLEQRTKEHKKSSKSGDAKCIYNAIRKYEMVDTLELIEIDTADTVEELCEKEIGYIIEYNSYYMNENGYNMTYGGEGTNGYIFTEEDNKKNSERQKKRFENPEVIKKQSEALKKYFENPEARQKNSESKIKYFEENPDAREKCSEAQKKRFENPEERQKNSESKKKYYEENPEARQKNSESKIKYFEENPDAGKEQGERLKKHYDENPDARKKCSEAQIKRFQENPDAGKEQGERLKKHYDENPEARKKCSEAQIKRFENPQARQKLSDGKGKNKPFDVFTLDGTFIKTFHYQFEAREYLQKEHHIISTIKICEVLEGHRKSSAGFVFKYK